MVSFLPDIIVPSKNRIFGNGFFLLQIAVLSKNRNFSNAFFTDIAVVSKIRNLGNGFFLADIAVVSKNQNFCNVIFLGRHSSGIKKSKFWQCFFFLADLAVVSKNRNFGNVFFLFFCFWQTQQSYQKIELLAMDVFGRHSSGIKKPKFCQWFLFCQT